MTRSSQVAVTKGCGDILSFDKQRVAACLTTTKDFACDAFAGKVDLAKAIGATDKDSLAKVWADLGGKVLEQGCRAGGKTASAACSVITQSTEHIVAALRGQSNPWADCVGTPAIGACVGQKWRELQTGVLDSDFAVGLQEPKKNPQTTKFENRVCWCWRRCMSDDFFADQEVFRGLWYQVAERGDAGMRFCAARNRSVVFPAMPMTVGGGRRKVFVKWDSCEITTARGTTPSLQTKDRKLEIFHEGRWQTFQMSEPGSCGGRTDQGV